MIAFSLDLPSNYILVLDEKNYQVQNGPPLRIIYDSVVSKNAFSSDALYNSYFFFWSKNSSNKKFQRFWISLILTRNNLNMERVRLKLSSIISPFILFLGKITFHPIFHKG